MSSGMGELIKASIEGLKSITDTDTVIGDPIHTPSGVTIIPVSKLSVGFAGGGFDLKNRKNEPIANLGSGSGSGISITPIAFLTVGQNSEVNLIYINQSSDTSAAKITSLIEKSPTIIQKIKDALF